MSNRPGTSGKTPKSLWPRLQQAMLRPGQLETAAIDADSAARAAHANLRSAGDGVAAASKKLEQLAESDPEVAAAQKQLTAAVNAVEAAERRYREAQKDVAA